jgi:muconolactone delta-isomerase
MKFLAVSQNTSDPSAHVAAEGARMAELAAAGTIEQVYLKADYSGAVLLADADDAKTLRAALDTLPLVINGVTSFAITEIVGAPK